MPDTGPYGLCARPRRRGARRRADAGALTLAAAAVAGSLAGCAGTVDVEPAPGGASPECREFVASLPSTLAGLGRRGADSAAAGVAAWGDPAVVLRCGTGAIGPTTLPCVSIDGVDWVVVAQGDDGAARLATFGRVPAVEVEVPGAYAPAPPVLTGLSDAVAALPTERACV